jgi:hypothetical protein
MLGFIFDIEKPAFLFNNNRPFHISMLLSYYSPFSYFNVGIHKKILLNQSNIGSTLSVFVLAFFIRFGFSTLTIFSVNIVVNLGAGCN